MVFLVFMASRTKALRTAFQRLCHQNETGQISIFVALMFQVLFVFFAMVINVGLVIHDKINLQNAVDLGAYYAAQRQAELLNEIAHINYQIRQDYKLLTWRYRVMGTLGRRSPASSTRMPQEGSGGENDNAIQAVNGYDGPEELPVSCLANQFWKEFKERSPQNENYCYQKYDSATVQIPIPPVIAGWIGLNSQVAAFAGMAQNLQAMSCQNAAPLNWAWNIQILFAYKMSVAARKDTIRSLRQNLISADPKDLNNESIRQGALNTIANNLTEANRASFMANVDENFQFLNGLSIGNCAQNEGAFLLPEVRIAPVLLYMYTHGNCLYNVMPHMSPPPNAGILGNINGMLTIARGEPGNPDDPYQSILGFEKNPWCMAYAGVTAKASPRKPFMPFGATIELNARAFAQPFGGRVGPWYGKSWPRGAPTSNDTGGKTDPLVPPRIAGSFTPGSIAGSCVGGQNADAYRNCPQLPNYSRFPGDQVGLKSRAAMALNGRKLAGFGSLTASGGTSSGGIPLAGYNGFPAIFDTGDPLHSQSPIRDAEIGAVAPDVFDITYYSVDPEFGRNYHERNLTNSGRFNLREGGKPQPDIGGNNTNATFSVVQQIQTARTSGSDPAVLGSAYWLVKQWQHLLTGWNARRLMDYSFPTDSFGQCEVPAPDSAMAPGKCIANNSGPGGRVGYSVRLVSKDHLMGGQWEVGGPGSSGQLENPPPGNF
jgi:hypothetical protein